ncbi:MAG: inositol monophosphatase family protein [Phaeodactylibacter sp.]|nr:inositol monophosphatase family protein [Phaeodactylibacter sp.]MCB0614182.1 inositol monophosphatase family protein [Phaeodactylibacter sp.]MCB9302932.1 inositol monophosphatase family protein [Lewinellaceae bacterium]
MDRQSILDFMRSMAWEAGNIMTEHYNGDYQIYTKPDRSKVTDVDLAISKIAQEQVARRFPDIGLHSEESPNKEIIKGKPYFIIDELDGTSYFIERKKGFSHQSAFYDPSEGLVIGLVYYPWNDTLLYAIKGEGAFVEHQGEGRALKTISDKAFHELTYAHPSRYTGEKYMRLFRELGVGDNRIIRTTANRTLLMSQGKLDVNIFLSPHIPIWDLAGEKVIVEELGFSHCYLDGSPVEFGQEPPRGNRGYLLCRAKWRDHFLEEVPRLLPSEYKKF